MTTLIETGQVFDATLSPFTNIMIAVLCVSMVWLLIRRVKPKFYLTDENFVPTRHSSLRHVNPQTGYNL